jgi:hypothetical protein
MIADFPVMLSTSKHSWPFFSNLLGRKMEMFDKRTFPGQLFIETGDQQGAPVINGSRRLMMKLLQRSDPEQRSEGRIEGHAVYER